MTFTETVMCIDLALWAGEQDIADSAVSVWCCGGIGDGSDACPRWLRRDRILETALKSIGIEYRYKLTPDGWVGRWVRV